MKKLFLLALATTGLWAASVRAQTITQSVGSGADTSYLVVEAASFGSPLTFAYLYDYNPANPFDSYTMMATIDAAVADLEFTYINYGTVDEPNFFLDAVTWQGSTLTSTGAPTFTPYWGQWVSGGEAGFPAAGPVPAGTWSLGSGISAPYRFVEPGSWDGLAYNDGTVAPSVTPVPEPSAVLLLVGAGCALVFRRRANRPA